MYDRSYGTSGYRPDPEFQRFPQKAAGHNAHAPAEHKSLSNMSRRRKILYWGLAGLALLFWLSYLFLGDFGFMLFRAPSFTGFPFGNRHYLVLFQNNYELRPTGGFISNYGVLTFSHGLYTGMEMHDVYGDIDDHEYLKPPLVVGTLLQGEEYQGHNFRDGNFDPDFRLSKDELIELYNKTYPDERIDGVFAIDFRFLEEWVGMYQSVTVNGITLTEENLFETLSTLASDVDRHSLTALSSRKDIAAPLIKTLVTKTLIFPWRLHEFIELLSKGFSEKHVLAAFNASGLSSSFHSRQWDGALPQSDLGDFLAINEGNYGGMKSDRYITRTVNYGLMVGNRRDVLGHPVLTATVSVTLTHKGSYNIPFSGDYSGYLRTMIPLSSKILSGASITEDREDVYVLGEIVRLKPGESATYTYTYELPEYVWQEDSYLLHLHKQPGTEGDYYTVTVHAPTDIGIDAPLMTVHENIATFDAHLTKDTNLTFALLPDDNAPRIISHKITALNQITIVFNEPLSADSASLSQSYKVIDLNQVNPDATDEVTVTGVQVDGTVVILTTSGMTEQPEEFYAVTLQGLADSAGNSTNPNPRDVTVVQRFAEAAEANSETEELTDSTIEVTSSIPSSDTSPNE